MWIFKTSAIEVTLHHHRDAPDVWLVSAPLVGVNRVELAEKDPELAKAEALLYLRDFLRKVLDSIPLDAVLDQLDPATR